MHVVKRNGEIEPYAPEKITYTIMKAMETVRQLDATLAETITAAVTGQIRSQYQSQSPPTVDTIKDVVAQQLVAHDQLKVAKVYLLYREEHRREQEFQAMLALVS